MQNQRVMRFSRLGGILVLGLTLTGAELTANETKETDMREANQRETFQHLNLANTTQAKQWGLSQTDWQRYVELMMSQRGIWSPGLDPLTALGVEARTDDERRRYAELWAQQEHDRVERERAFAMEVSEAFKRLYPGEVPLEFPPEDASNEHVETQAGRLLLFASNTTDCRDQLKQLQDALGGSMSMDIYVSGFSDDDALRGWAATQKIDLDAVRAGRITINHERGQLHQLSVAKETLPQLMRMNVEGNVTPFVLPGDGGHEE